VGTEVGGDFYDVFSLAPDRWGVAIGDVCGKGAEAAAVTGMARQALRLLGREGHPPAVTLQRLNAAILEEGERARFITVFYGEVTLPAGGGVRLNFVCAGHPQPWRLCPDGVVMPVGTSQPLLGVMEDVAFAAETLDLLPGEALVAVTDGVTERRDGCGRMLGERGLAAVLSTVTSLPAQAVAGRVQRAVLEFADDAPRDDLAVLVLRAR
jgi:serine phosphatase RsbU (regulator of sigma subunit)